ncbi:hypothetical protein L2E82_35686 [Cichorium intybus]|uniref:Uncharacterized protein n=1 Tax=Cichorium intybus TaxID=13427 RepID=A0ACB9BPV1_CICIN|nr:hypothetical protein L2E82_35686 [Cichorium intybus]
MEFRQDHPFLRFPEVLEDTPQYIARRHELSSRPVLAAVQLDRMILTQAGLWAELEPFIYRTWTNREYTFTSHDWDRLMANEDDVVYKELLLEFLSTCRSHRHHERHGLRWFGLDWGREPGVQSPQPRRDANATIWAEMSDDQFEAKSAWESQLRDPLHRLMHRIKSTSVMQKRGCEKVSGNDMTFMWSLSDPTRFLHLPYALAVSLTTRAAGVADSSPMAGGHYVTRLARSYGLLTAEIMTTLTATPPAQTSIRYLEIVRLIHQPRPSVIMRMTTEAPQGPQAQLEPEQPTRRWRRREEPPADQPQMQLADVLTDIRDLSERLMRLEDQ